MQPYPQLVESLLKRKPIEIDKFRTEAAIAGKTVLVTGATGSIGSNLCYRIAEIGPRRLVLLDKSEHGLYQLGLDLEAATSPETPGSQRPETPPLAEQARLAPARLTPALGDICDSGFLQKVFDDYRPDLVFHSAAYKHVTLLEYQPHAAIRNNVIGTYRLVDAALEHRVPRLVMLSTDKAVNPASIMGASKRISELMVMAASTPGCKMTSVRLGNVIGSQGSVVPRFAGQIEKGRPLTVTDPRATRYLMTPAEAADLVLASAWLGQGADIIVPDVGDPVRIVDLAREMIKAAGLAAGDIVFTGLGPGEKLSEELLGPDERTLHVPACPVRRVVDANMPPLEIEHYVSELDRLSAAGDTDALIAMVCGIVPEYRPSPVLAEGVGRIR